MKIGIYAFVILLSVPAAARTADDPVSIDVTPRSCVAPCNVRLTVRVLPDAANREVTISADSIRFYRSSSREVTEGSPSLHRLVLRDLPSGLYEVRVTVDRVAASDAQRVARFRVHD